MGKPHFEKYHDGSHGLKKGSHEGRRGKNLEKRGRASAVQGQSWEVIGWTGINWIWQGEGMAASAPRWPPMVLPSGIHVLCGLSRTTGDDLCNQ